MSAGRVPPFGVRLAHARDALAIRERNLDQMRAKQLLHRREAVESKGIGEADQRRRLHTRVARQRGHGLERKVVRALERHLGNALQLARQRAIAGGDRIAKLFVAAGTRCAHRCLSVRGSVPDVE